jgi:hypothetical protein
MVNPNVTLDVGRRFVARASVGHARRAHQRRLDVFQRASIHAGRPHEPAAAAGRQTRAGLPEFDETPRQILLQIKFSDTQTLRGSRSADIPLTDLWDLSAAQPEPVGGGHRRAAHQIHGRLAAPWTCLVVVLIAIPFGAPSGRRNLVFRRGRQHFHLFHLFCFAAGEPRLRHERSSDPGWLAAWLPNMFSPRWERF